MKHDAFSRCHPAVNFIFFLGAIGACVVLQHPAYLLASLLAAAIWSYLLTDGRSLRLSLSLLPLFLLIALINPLFSTAGQTVLFSVFARPYTLEALIYGALTALTLLGATLWFSCYSAVMTNDKFTSLFAPVAPSLSLLLVMVMRLIPRLGKKAHQISTARRCIGKDDRSVRGGARILSALTDDALEGSIQTADSMRARGYGSAKRTVFRLYRMRNIDWLLLISQTGLLLATILLGRTAVEFTPVLQVQTVSWGFGAYCLYVFSPIILHCKEAIQWRRLQSKI